MVGNTLSPLPLGEVPQFANWGGEGLNGKNKRNHTLSVKNRF